MAPFRATATIRLALLMSDRADRSVGTFARSLHPVIGSPARNPRTAAVKTSRVAIELWI